MEKIFYIVAIVALFLLLPRWLWGKKRIDREEEKEE